MGNSLEYWGGTLKQDVLGYICWVADRRPVKGAFSSGQVTGIQISETVMPSMRFKRSSPLRCCMQRNAPSLVQAQAVVNAVPIFKMAPIDRSISEMP